MLSHPEIRAIWWACQRPREVEGLALSEDMGLSLRMAMTTLQRGGEVVGMRWDEIDRKAKTWTIPAVRMKGKRPHKVPLSELALSLLNEADEVIGGKEFVFQSRRSQSAMDRRAFTRAMSASSPRLGSPVQARMTSVARVPQT